MTKDTNVALRDKIAGWISEETGVTGGTVFSWLNQLAAQEPSAEAELSDDELAQIVWKIAPSIKAESVLVRASGPYEIGEPTHLLRQLARAILAARRTPAKEQS